jgi:copper(I)-binding protein
MSAIESRRPLLLSRTCLALLACLASAGLAQAADVEIVKAWVAPAEKAGADVHLQMTVVNKGAEPDALLRVRCAIANFSEKYTIDHGEGAPAMRAVPSIAVDANGSTVLATGTAHVMLLQTRQPLAEGDHFACTASFRKAGSLDMTVDVRAKEPAS